MHLRIYTYTWIPQIKSTQNLYGLFHVLTWSKLEKLKKTNFLKLVSNSISQLGSFLGVTLYIYYILYFICIQSLTVREGYQEPDNSKQEPRKKETRRKA